MTKRYVPDDVLDSLEESCSYIFKTKPDRADDHKFISLACTYIPLLVKELRILRRAREDAEATTSPPPTSLKVNTSNGQRQRTITCWRRLTTPIIFMRRAKVDGEETRMGV